MGKRIVKALVYPIAVWACAVGTNAAAAQTEPPATAPGPEAVTPSNGVRQGTPSTAAAAADGSSIPGDIVVTARKRSESLQRVPAAVSVVGNERLETLGITNLTQIANVAPGISVTPVRSQAFIFIRGVGQTLTSPNADASVATNLNGVYLPAEIAGTAFFDVDRVEILPGPQGTLYGRNSTGGVVNIISRTPGEEFGANGLLEVGNYGRVQVVGAVNVPLTSTLASRTAATLVRHNGYFNNGLDDQRTFAVRQTLVWRPGDRTRVTGVATYTHDGGIGSALQNIPFQECGPRCATFNPKALGYTNDVDTAEASLQIDQELTDDLDLTYIGGYSKLDLFVRNTVFTGPPLAPLVLRTEIDSQSHELRLTGEFGRFDTILGAYYFDSDTYYEQDATPTAAARLFNPFDGESNGYAFFGQGTYSVLPDLRLTGGLRYSHTLKRIDGFNSAFSPAGAQLFNRPYQGESTLDRVDWKVAFEYDLTRSSMLYGSVSTGFTPGGFSTGPAAIGQTAAATFEPVFLRAYAAGIKNRLFDNAVTLNVEGFYYDYKNYQVSARDILTAQNLVFNAEKATIYGAQVDARADLGRNDELSISGTYLHAKADILRVPGRNFDGFDLPYSPRWTANVFYQHRFDLDRDAQIRGSVNFKYTSSRWAIYTHAPGFDIPANTHTDLNLGYFAANDRWSLQAFVRNLEDELVKTSCGNALPGLAGCFFEPPRTYGAALSFNF